MAAASERTRMSEAGNDGDDSVVVDDAAMIRQSWHDPQMFGTIFSRHASHVHRYLALRLGREVADDLVAETFVAAFRRRHAYDLSRPNARPWLYGIATHLVGQHRREEAREYRLRQAIGPDRDDACHADRVSADVTAQGWRAGLSRALADLSPGDRHVLLLVAWGDLTYEEVSTVLNIPIGTVRSRLNRARKKVKRTLGAVEFATTMKEQMSHG
jgi:RNA polymerase sigma-70 factor (ECF subfamily)